MIMLLLSIETINKQNTRYEVMWNVVLVSAAIIIPLYVACYILHHIYLVNKATETSHNNNQNVIIILDIILVSCIIVCNSYPKEQRGHMLSSVSIITPNIVLMLWLADLIKFKYLEKIPNQHFENLLLG